MWLEYELMLSMAKLWVLLGEFIQELKIEGLSGITKYK